jgi:hypothetical protein
MGIGVDRQASFTQLFYMHVVTQGAGRRNACNAGGELMKKRDRWSNAASRPPEREERLERRSRSEHAASSALCTYASLFPSRCCMAKRSTG